MDQTSQFQISPCAIDQTQVRTSLTQAQLCQFAAASIDQGARLVCDQQSPNTYYLAAQLQLSASLSVSEVYVPVDRGIIEASLKVFAAGTVVSTVALERDLMPMLLNTARYTVGAGLFLRLLLAATDDSKQVRLNGVRISIMAVARDSFMQRVRSFWARIGATARWGTGDPAHYYLKG